ncbi:MJ0042 family finger-like domain protein [Candidatus Pelagibacter sp. HTCC7211]|jgi:predicted Zn finger-like uncharacterized protein|uniref:zinc-ribbon domain-containing protein n=1 Tax=Pelagibacter sp. (strain HTCC7211) TaxID=439493 RepID=UPI000183BA91|nr:zinc-ribbon domain-containing protein [Candidatus Pelagibacter sp. HTCC7211]EDZ60888.1 MJ0042 family finger-like domain protein [Candidatus Pelagibacter sp. HTCC7211]
MIISCPSCHKKFKIEDALIPSKGRNLQCGSCNHNWFYKIEHKIAEPLKLEVNIEEKIEPSDDNVLISDTSESLKAKLEKELDNDVKNDYIIQNSDLPKKSENITFSKFLSYIIVSIISFAVFVILIDTLKTPLIDIFPGLEILLFNLFETLQDIKLFIIDLS